MKVPTFHKFGITKAQIVKAETRDKKISDILNYIRNSWDNKGSAITPGQVKTQREKNKNEQK